jgi:hypothetical protein
MKLNVLFGKQKVDWFATNIRIVYSLQQELENTDNRLISYTLNDLPLTKKFIEYWQIYRKSTADRLQEPYMEYNVNYYPMQSTDMFFSAKQEMNEMIARLQSFGIEVDNGLLLNQTSSDNEIKKLNELHFIFEKEAINLKSVVPEICSHYGDIWYALEKINNLVHFLETFDNKNIKKRLEHFYIAIRPGVGIAEKCFPYYTLQDQDYIDFIKPSGGDLVCDFATVGKDLFYCSCTNDIELVKRQEVKQQTQLTDFIFLNFGGQEKEPYFEDHYKWCEENHIEKYLDYKSPRYNPGRHVFGKIDEPIYTGRSFYENILSKTPAFLGYYLSDDSGNPLVPEGM